MTQIKEGSIAIDFSQALKVRRFDDINHGLSFCMKAVDFIVELEKSVLFVEVKDPPDYDLARKEAEKFAQRFSRGELDQDLYYKYRDTFLYEWASGNIKKPIYYLLLINIQDLSEAELLNRTDELKRKLPVAGPATGVWKRKLVSDCMVFNLETWNKHLSRYQAKRLSPDA